jgi:hypothetical protein
MLRLLSCLNHEGHEGLGDFGGEHCRDDIRSTGRPAKQASDERHAERFANFVFFVIFVVKASVFFVVPEAA